MSASSLNKSFFLLTLSFLIQECLRFITRPRQQPTVTQTPIDPFGRISTPTPAPEGTIAALEPFLYLNTN